MKKYFSFFLAILFCGLCFCSEPEVNSERHIVKVGVYESNGFIDLNNMGEVTGHGLKFMKMLSDYANVDFEYVRLSWSECLEQLQTGKIDIVTDARKTFEREKIYDFSVQNVGQIQAAIFVLKTNDDIYFNDYEKLGQLKIGFEKDSVNKLLYENYALQHGILANTVEYLSNSDLMAALKKGEIDAFGNDPHLVTDELKVVSIYNNVPNYIMALKGSKILSQLNLSIEQMYFEHPKMLTEQENYIPGRQFYGDVLLTRKEAEFIKENPVLKVAVPLDRRPASWYDAKTGEYHGIAIDMMKRLGDETGLNFEFYSTKKDDTADSILSEGTIDIFMPTISSMNNSDSPIVTSEPLFSLSVVLAKKTSNRLNVDKPFTVALKYDNRGIAKTLKENYPFMIPVYYDSTEECIEAVKKNKVEAFGNSFYEVEYYLQSPRNNNISIEYTYTCPIDYCLSVSKNSPSELINIINAGISLLSQKESEQLIRFYNTNYKYHYTFWDVVQLYSVHIIVVICIILICFAFLFAYSLVQKSAMKDIQKKSIEVEKANAAKSEFLACMSHDMRTPMNGILGLIQIVEDVNMPDDVKEALSDIKIQGNFLLRMINDILEMSKLENNMFSLSLKSIYSKELLDDTLLLTRNYALQKAVKIDVFEINLNHCYILADKVRVQQVVENIVSNAIKFSKKDDIIQIRVENLGRINNTCKIKFEVIDEGCGIDDDFKQKMFVPFEREDNSGLHEGAGLGLPIAKSIMNMMGGSIEVESKKGIGTKVTLIFNFEYSNEENQNEEKSLLDESRLNRVRVLLCEDNQINTMVVVKLLQKQGCLVDCAIDGQKGIDLFQKSEDGYYNVILMDIRMPVKDGVETTKEIRALNRKDSSSVPIFAVTANLFDDDIKKYLAAGMNDVIAKPIDANELMNKIKMVIN